MAVMGSQGHDVVPDTALTRLIPAWTHFNMGNEDWSLGSGKPSDSYMFLTAAR